MVGKELEMAHNAGIKRAFSQPFAGICFVLLALASSALAGCSLLTPPQQALEVGEPTATFTPTITPSPTWPLAWTATPTFTPWPATATPTPTYTPIPTVTPLPPGVTPVRPRPRPSGPLTIDFELGGVWCGGGAYFADFVVSASGGGGRYTYYRDIDPIGGPTDNPVEYRLEWMECGGAPGTFFVKSADGQVASKLFWVHPPSCCEDDD
jgi:hypothetical protein